VHTVNKITEIDIDVFNTMYEANKTQLVSNIGFDDLEQFRNTFVYAAEDKMLFQAVDDSSIITAYYIGYPENDTAYMCNMITRTEDTLPLTIESSANILKSLGFTKVSFCVKEGTSTYNYTKASMNRPELYEYLTEKSIGDYMKVTLRLV
tara:strand:+ start:637 stop:1086 length:450 start_codon:yes stop_codon:yes gene_type:complete